MNKHAKRKWVKALRSGRYRKANSVLGYIEDTGYEYCCLGVFAEEMVPEFVSHNGCIAVDEHISYLPDDLAIMYDLPLAEQKQLARLNDRYETFGPIADYIEREL